MKSLLAVVVVWVIAPLITVNQPEVKPVEPKQITQTVADTPKDKPAPAKKQSTSKPVIDPKGCEPEQYWSKEPPHNCIPKPIESAATDARPVGADSCEAYRHLVEQYDWDVDTMMYAMRHESTTDRSACDPNAVGDEFVIDGIYAPSCGLLQVRTLPGRPSCEELKDPATNVHTAYIIWTSQGYGAWTVLH